MRNSEARSWGQIGLPLVGTAPPQEDTHLASLIFALALERENPDVLI